MKFKTFQALLISGGVVVGGLVIFLVGRAILNRPDTPPPRPQAAVSSPPRSHVDALGERLGKPSGGETKIKDLLGGGPVKINVYADAGVWNRAKVDYDRDEKWDEKWRWEAGVVYRAIAPNDDEVYGAEQVVGGPARTPEPVANVDTPAVADELREVDRLMLELLERPVQAKIKDASKGRPFKINLYSDDGQRFNRAKVDLDRDDKWDEKWTFKPDGAVEREVAPGDDESYSERSVLEAGVRWQRVD